MRTTKAKPPPEPALAPVEHEPLTRSDEALSRWHSAPGNREELAQLLKNPTLSLALSTLQVLAEIQPNNSTDVTALALSFKRAEGYQTLLNNLRALAVPPPSKPKKMPEQFSHLTQTTTTTNS